jgi:2-methylcitrate dehydratase PrpD
MDDIWVKVYPMCGGIHSAAQVLQQLRGERPLKAGDVESVRIGVSRFAARNNGEPAPVDTMGAQYSIPYCAAVALLADPGDPAMFAEAALAEPALRELASRVTVYADDEAESVYPRRLAARVELRLSNGEVRSSSALDAHGTPADPCTSAERDRRFRQLASAAKAAPAVGDILDACGRIDALASVRSLSRALQA